MPNKQMIVGAFTVVAVLWLVKKFGPQFGVTI